MQHARHGAGDDMQHLSKLDGVAMHHSPVLSVLLCSSMPTVAEAAGAAVEALVSPEQRCCCTASTVGRRCKVSWCLRRCRPMAGVAAAESWRSVSSLGFFLGVDARKGEERSVPHRLDRTTTRA
ncbi:hypothetical protein VPH35_129455 [Triticum aestivum]